MKRRKFNVVDLVIIILVALLLVFGCYKLLTRGGSETGGDSVNITYTVKVRAQEPEAYAAVQRYIPGDLMAGGERVEGRVTQVTSEPSTFYVTASDASGNSVLMPVTNDELVDLTFTIEAVVEAGPDGVMLTQVGTQEVRIGKSHIVKTDQIEMTGTILDVHWGDE